MKNVDKNLKENVNETVFHMIVDLSAMVLFAFLVAVVIL